MATNENSKSEYFTNLSDEELSREIKFHYNYAAWIVSFTAIFVVATFLSAFIANYTAKTTETLYDSGATVKLPEMWGYETQEAIDIFAPSLSETQVPVEEKYLFSDKNGLNFYFSIDRKLSKDEVSALKMEFKNRKESILKYKGTKWLPGETALDGYQSYIARYGDSLYTVATNTADDTIIAALNIRPFGFWRGLLDGLLLPFQALGHVFENSLRPIKTESNGFSYVAGFIIGCLLLLVIIVLLWYIIIELFSTKKSASEKMEQDRQEEVARREWERKWAAMSVDEKVAYITQQYCKAQAENVKKVEKLNKKYVKISERFEGASPDAVLAIFDKQAKAKGGVLSSVGGFFADAFTAGEAGLDAAKAQYDRLVDVYKYYEARYKVSLENLVVVNLEYNFIRQKAVLYMRKIKEIIAELPIKERAIFDKLEDIKFNQGLLSNKSIQAVFKSIEKFNANYRAQAEESFDKSMETAGNIFKDTDKYLTKQMKKNKGNLSDEDLLVAGIGVAAGLVTIAGEGISQYFGNIDRTGEAKMRFQEGEFKLRQGIEDIEKTNRPKVQGLIDREKELIFSLNQSMERYVVVFNKINAYLFPADDKSKTKEARQNQKDQGGQYFTAAEFQKIMELREFNKFLGTFVDADL
jgi:hypothetical protein